MYRIFENGGGSLTSRSIMFVRIVKDFGHDIDYRTSSKNENDEDEYNLYLDGRERHLIYKVGEISVGYNEKFLKILIKTDSKILPVMFANACAPPTASSSISHSVLVEESIHTGESDIENAFAN